LKSKFPLPKHLDLFGSFLSTADGEKYVSYFKPSSLSYDGVGVGEDQGELEPCRGNILPMPGCDILMLREKLHGFAAGWGGFNTNAEASDEDGPLEERRAALREKRIKEKKSREEIKKRKDQEGRSQSKVCYFFLVYLTFSYLTFCRHSYSRSIDHLHTNNRLSAA
jgi:hypothetical protein